jgi:hypothetical protein
MARAVHLGDGFLILEKDHHAIQAALAAIWPIDYEGSVAPHSKSKESGKRRLVFTLIRCAFW